jgi:drug/metabolite transporter (DMT)-like permease
MRSLFQRPSADRPITALILLLTGVFAIAFQDSLVKLMSVHTSFWQFQLLRSLGNLGFVTILALFSGGVGLLIPRNWRPVYLRAGILLICMFFFFSGAPFLSVAQMAAGLYTYPIFISLLAIPILGERVGRWRIFAILIGAVGAAFVLNPWDANFSLLQVLPILAGLFYAANILTIRKACRNESPLALAFAAAITFVIAATIVISLLSLFPLSSELRTSMPFVAIGWPELTLLVAAFALFASVLNLSANICISRAYQTADASWLAPVDFSNLNFAAFWSQLIFNQWPTRTAIIGMILIGTAGIITAWRERVAANLTRQVDTTTATD